ncbi:proprotein convertase P-domain-containing protein [bacterium]|nr:proprotein convertase P-domain-containing protein [bacterium]
MKKLLTVCTMLAFVVSTALASGSKEVTKPVETSGKSADATKQVIHQYDHSLVKPLPREAAEDEREAQKLELESLTAAINALSAEGKDYSAQKARANELYELLFPARGADRLDQGGETCANATVISGIPYCDQGTTVGYLNDYSGGCHSTGGPDVVYEFTPAADVVAVVSLLGSGYDTGLHVWEGCPGSGILIGCNDDFGSLQSCLQNLLLFAGRTYYIVVDGFSIAWGTYTLHVSNDGVCGSGDCPRTCTDPGPVADHCEDAILAPVPSIQYGSTVGTSAEVLGFCGTSDGLNGGVWYKVVGNGNTFTASTCEPCTDFDTKLRVFTCGCDLHTCVAGNDDDFSCTLNSLRSTVSWATDAGATYYILVHGFSTNAGRFGLVLSDDGVPSNGDGITCPCHDGSLAAPGTTNGTTVGSGNDCPTRPSQELVIQVSIPYSADWRFSLCGSQYDTYLYVGTDCCLGDIGSNDDACGLQSEICTFVPQGIVYVTIEAYNSFGAGDYTLTVEPCVPPVGSCCYSVAPFDVCSVPLCVDGVLESECDVLGGVWTRFGTCAENPCPSNVPCVCECATQADAHATFAVDATTYPISEVYPTTCVTINVPIEYQITDLDVCLDLVHTWDGDLDITLTSPMGTVVQLSNRRGANGDNYTCTTFDDEAATPIGAGAAPFSGSFQPETALSDVDGENALGDWLLCVTDNVGGDQGHILGVCLKFEYDRILPVNFGSFDAVAGDRQVTLNWNTLSENNVHHFDVIRDGSKVAEVAATNSATGSDYRYVDGNLTNGTIYSYSLVSVDVNGARQELASVEATPNAGAAVITEYALHQNYPNPFNPTTNIAFDLVDAGLVKISVYNVMGQKVAELVNGSFEAGRHVVSFDATGLSSGLYLYKMEANGFTAQAKMVLMK